MIWVHVPIQNIFKDFWENQTKLISSENSPDLNPIERDQSFRQIMLFKTGEVKHLWTTSGFKTKSSWGGHSKEGHSSLLIQVSKGTLSSVQYSCIFS